MSRGNFFTGLIDGIETGNKLVGVMDSFEKRAKAKEIDDITKELRKELPSYDDNPANAQQAAVRGGVAPMAAPDPVDEPVDEPVPAPVRDTSAAAVNPALPSHADLYGYLRKKGVSETHAMGMLANIERESGRRIGVVNHTDGGSYGIFQYNGSRREALHKAAGQNPTWQQQIDYAMTEPDTAQYLGQEFATPEQATEAFTREWERSKFQDADVRKSISMLPNIQREVSGADTRMAGTDDNAGMPVPAGPLPASRVIADSGATRAAQPERAVAGGLSGEQYANLYRKYSLKAAGNLYAERLQPALNAIKSIGLTQHMDEFTGDTTTVEGSLAYAHHLGRGMAMFGQFQGPKDMMAMASTASSDRRANNQDQRAENADQRDEANDSQVNARNEDANRRNNEESARKAEEYDLKEGERNLEQMKSVYKLLLTGNTAGAIKAANKAGVEIKDVQHNQPIEFAGKPVVTTTFTMVENGAEIQTNTHEFANRVGQAEGEFDQMTTKAGAPVLKTIKDRNGQDVLVQIKKGPDGKLTYVPVEPEGGAPVETEDNYGEDVPSEKDSPTLGSWMRSVFGGDKKEEEAPSEPPGSAGKSAPATEKPAAEEKKPAEKAEEKPKAGTYGDADLGIVQVDESGKTTVVHENGKVLEVNGKRYTIIKGQAVPQ